jgi:hypothetical protein
VRDCKIARLRGCEVAKLRQMENARMRDCQAELRGRVVKCYLACTDALHTRCVQRVCADLRAGVSHGRVGSIRVGSIRVGLRRVA